MATKTKMIKGKEVVFLIGRGENCTCADCPVLYGGECYTTDTNNKKATKGRISSLHKKQ